MTEVPKRLWVSWNRTLASGGPSAEGVVDVSNGEIVKAPGTYYVDAEIADKWKRQRDALLETARAVIERITPTMEGSVDGDYIGGALYHSDEVIKGLRLAFKAVEEANPDG